MKFDLDARSSINKYVHESMVLDYDVFYKLLGCSNALLSAYAPR